MMLVEVHPGNLADAAYVHAMAWQESHRSFCSEEFVRRHTPKAQAEYLSRKMACGAHVYMLLDDEPVGIVSVDGSVIADLYVLPERQNRGYGGKLLQFAVEKCENVPRLWVMNINTGAKRLYERNGFVCTGAEKQLKDGLAELEMIYSGNE